MAVISVSVQRGIYRFCHSLDVCRASEKLAYLFRPTHGGRRREIGVNHPVPDPPLALFFDQIDSVASVVPRGQIGKLPDFKSTWDLVAVSMGLNFEAKKGKTVIEKMRAGSYRVIAGKASADVQVMAGVTVTAELQPQK